MLFRLSYPLVFFFYDGRIPCYSLWFRLVCVRIYHSLSFLPPSLAGIQGGRDTCFVSLTRLLQVYSLTHIFFFPSFAFLVTLYSSTLSCFFLFGRSLAHTRWCAAQHLSPHTERERERSSYTVLFPLQESTRDHTTFPICKVSCRVGCAHNNLKKGPPSGRRRKNKNKSKSKREK
jgi:hypothetical protein